MLEEIEQVLDARVRPRLALHGGAIRSLACEDGVYRFQLLGACSACPAAGLTAESLVRDELLQAVPGLRDVELSRQVSGQLLDQARAILSRRHG